MRICLISGHGYNSAGGYDSGAIAYDGTHESVLNDLITERCAKKLREWDHDVTVIKTAVYQDLLRGYKRYDFKGFDYVLEIHNNAFNKKTRGTEIYVTSKEVATTVEQEIVKRLGSIFINRGVKRTDFLVIRYVKNQGVSSALVEVCFIDNNEDLQLYYKNQERIPVLIAEGIHVGFGLSIPKPQVKPTPEPIAVKLNDAPKGKIWRILAVSNKNGELATSNLAKLKAQGWQASAELVDYNE